MLRKIDCVMIRVEDPEAAALYYSDVFGPRRIWQDETSVGLGFPESDAEIVLHRNPEIPSQVDGTCFPESMARKVKLPPSVLWYNANR